LDVSGTTLNPSGNKLGGTGYQSLTLSVGGEKWITPQWAFRMGAVYQDETNNGALPYTTFYYPDIAPGVELETATLTAGVGFQENAFYGDLTLSCGQSVRDNPATDAFASRVGAQLAAGVRFN
jgi:hypothetical protein